MCRCWKSKGLGYRQINDSVDESNPYVCRWLYCLLWTLIPLCIVIFIVLMVLFLAVVPNMAQSAADNSVLVQNHIVISHITNSSLRINSSVQLLNVGAYACDIKSVIADVSTDEGKIGEMRLPHIHVDANKGTDFSIISDLMVSDRTILRHSVHNLLNGKDVDWYVSSKADITVHLAGSPVKTSVNMNNTLKLRASDLKNTRSDNFTVYEATSTMVKAKAAMSFSTSTDMILEVEDIQFNLYTLEGTYLGQSLMPNLVISAGYNEFLDLPTNLIKNGENQDALNIFISKFMMGITQEVRAVGPIPHDGHSTCVDHVINTTIKAQGITSGDVAVAGISTSESQTGWVVNINGNDTTLRGAYTTVKNPLGVKNVLLKVDVNLDLKEKVSWGFQLVNFVQNCTNVTQYAHLYTGYGMYEDNPNKTWVDLEPYGETSFFVIGEPQVGQSGWPDNVDPDDQCMGTLFLMPCCFITEPTAMACYYNQKLATDMGSQLTQAHIPAELYSVMEVAIDGEFEATLTYNQTTFPVYFGYEIYAGYDGDIGFNCEYVKFPYWSGGVIDTPSKTQLKF